MVPGGQRMEAMSRDKWLVFDLGEERVINALELLGIVDSFGPARVSLQCAPSSSGPWRPMGRGFRALGTMRWQRVELPGTSARFCRLYIRREGHATFRHAVHGVIFRCAR